VVADEKTKHQYNYQSIRFNSYLLLNVLQLAMLAIGFRRPIRTCISITRMQTGAAWDCLQVRTRPSDNHCFQNKEKT
jgi:hypothetical protein